MPRQETSAQIPNIWSAPISPSVEAGAVSEKPRRGVFYIPQGPEACDPSTGKAESRRLGAQGQPQLLRKLEASLRYMKFSIKQNNKNYKTHSAILPLSSYKPAPDVTPGV